MPTPTQPQWPQNASRYTGLGLVIAIHLLFVIGLASGLHRTATKPPPAPIKAELLKDEVKPPEPEPLLRPEIKFSLPTVDRLPIPDIEIHATLQPVITAEPLTEGMAPQTGPRMPTADAPLGKLPAIAALPAVTSAAMVCTKMGKPELPVLAWTGEALFRAVATVQAGRVVSTEIQSLRGGLDAKTRRSLHAAIDGALRDSYECPGDHRFEQEFRFRVE